ncbi:hypothetical protein [Desulfitobacterium sp. AusDCA]|uniref:hypothetical protein n=1 Tax=Desulfitobacterium sp. AusDCA TaxID=3240383 RepID=UPI003DA78FBA
MNNLEGGIFLRISIVKKSLLSMIMVMICVFSISIPTFAATDYTYVTFPSYDTTASNPQPALVSDNNLLVGCRFVGACPILYGVGISEVDSNGNYIPGYSYYTAVSDQNAIRADYSAGGKTFFIPTTGLVKGHIYRVEVFSAYSGQTNGFESYGYYIY